jgi:peptidoglycan/xylan/chitin deacetylase (PgdA/CDA1 family)
VISALLATGAGLGAGALALGAYHPNSPIFGPVVSHGPAGVRSLYLTFDDGPNPTATARILDVLAAERVPAAFFLVGDHVRRFPELARAVVTAGHVAGNHTNTHVKLHRCGPRRVRRELEAAHRAIAEMTGAVPRVFRAPHGYRNPFVARAVRRLGYTVVGWSYGVWDSARPGAAAIRARVLRRLRPGAVILLHDGDGYDPTGDRGQTADALPGIIRDARAAGFAFASLTDLVPR